MRRAIALLLCLIAAALGVWIIWFGTRQGVGTFGDSVTYFEAATSVSQGHGFRQHAADGSFMPLLQFPPGYPIVLAAFGKVFGGIVDGARYINFVAIALAVLLIGHIVYTFTRQPLVAFLAAATYAASGQVMSLYIRMYSEPTYIAFMLLMIAVLMRRGPRGGWLVVAGCIGGAAILVRFAGVHLIACVMLWIVLMNWRFGWKKLLKRLAAFAIPAAGAAAMWAIRNRLTAGKSSSRLLDFHPPKWEAFRMTFDVMKRWVFPVENFGVHETANLQMTLLIVVLTLWTAVPIYALLKRGLPLRGIRARLALPVIFAMTYTPFIWFAHTFLDGSIPFNYRLLIPAHSVSLIVVAIWFWGRWHAWPKRSATWAKGVLTVIALGFLYMIGDQVNACYTLGTRTGEQGLGYGTALWKNSGGMAMIRNLPPNTIIYTNAADAVYLLTGRSARTLPHSYASFGEKQAKKLVQHGLGRLRRQLTREHAIIIYFLKINRARLMVTERQLKPITKDLHMEQLSDARMYYVKTSKKKPHPTTAATAPATTRPAKAPEAVPPAPANGPNEDE